MECLSRIPALGSILSLVLSKGKTRAGPELGNGVLKVTPGIISQNVNMLGLEILTLRE